jgi:hypothetical protein
MNLDTLARLIFAEEQLLLKTEEWARATNDKTLRRKICRLMHGIEQDLAAMQDTNEPRI